MPQIKLTSIKADDRLVLIGQLWKIKAWTMLHAFDKKLTVKEFLRQELSKV